METCACCGRPLDPPLEIDEEFRLVRSAGRSVALGPQAFALVDAVKACAPRPAHRDWLMDVAWPHPPPLRTFERTLQGARAALSQVGWTIRGQWGVGAYRLERVDGDVRRRA